MKKIDRPRVYGGNQLRHSTHRLKQNIKTLPREHGNSNVPNESLNRQQNNIASSTPDIDAPQTPDLSVVTETIIPNLQAPDEQLRSSLKGNLRTDNGNMPDRGNSQDNKDRKKGNNPKNRVKNWLKRKAVKAVIANIIPIATAFGGLAAVGSCSAAMFTGGGNENTVVEQDRGQDVKYSIDVECTDDNGGSGSDGESTETSSSSNSNSSDSSDSSDSSNSSNSSKKSKLKYTDPVINGRRVCSDLSVGQEIADLAVKCALTAMPEERVHAPHDWPWPDKWRDQFDPRADNQIALCAATLGANGGNGAVASCTQCAVTILSAVADPDMSGTWNGIMASAGPGDGKDGFLPYVLARPELYKKVHVTTSNIRPGDILANEHHTAIWVGTKAARVKFSDTTGNVYEGGYNDGWTSPPSGSYSETMSSGSSTLYNCDACALLPGIDEYGDAGSGFRELSDFSVFRVIKKNPNPQHEFVDYKSIVGDGSTGGDGGSDSHSAAIVNACKTTPSPGAGWCAAWVSNVYQNAGLPRPGGNGNSILDGSSSVSTDWSKIKVGQIVSCQKTPTAAGAVYGHTGIYIGNGQVMDNIGYIRTISLKQWVDDYDDYGWVKYGWPW